MRSALKQRVESALTSVPFTRMARHRIRGKRLILAYHGITPDGTPAAGERSLFVSQRDFAAQLDALIDIAEVVPLDRIDAEGDDRPRVSITFDDAYRGAVNEGAVEIAKRNLTATIFVAPGRLNGHVFWWDALSGANGELNGAVRRYALHKLLGSDEQIRKWADSIKLPSSDVLPAYAQTATCTELRAATALPGITVGSHTWSHANLAGLAEVDIVGELSRSRDWLDDMFGDRMIPWIAYPYGLDSAEAHRAAAATGYVGGLRIGGGWHRAGDVSPLARPRLSVPGGISVPGFRARVQGVLRA